MLFPKRMAGLLFAGVLISAGANSLPGENLSANGESILQTEKSVQISFHPSSSLLGLRLDIVGKTDAVGVQVTGQGGKKIVDRVFPVGKGRNVRYLKLPALSGGSYQVELSLISGGRTERRLQRSFERQFFPWENGRLGISEKIYPPFQKLQYRGSTVKTVTSEVTFNDYGLYSSLIADGKELLAGPISLHCRDAAGKSELKVISRGFVFQKANGTLWKSKMQGNGFQLENTVETEYDGCSKFTLTLIPEKNRAPFLRSFYLDIPLRSEIIRLFHVVSAGAIRSNPAVKVPRGEGVLWKSSENVNGSMPGNMHCYLWLGEMARGLCWFSDSTEGMSLSDKKDAQELIRHGREVILRIHFVNQEMKLNSKRTIVFGMQPSPTKPMPRDWRKPEFPVPPHGGSAYYGGGFAGMSKYPVGDDWEIVERMVTARQTGKLDGKFLENWLKKYWEGDPRYQNARAHIYAGFINFIIRRRKAPTMFYFEEYAIEQYLPEFITFQDEWARKEFSRRQWLKRSEITSTKIAASSVKILPVKSYQDYALWYAKKWFEHGIGLYFDNVYPKSFTSFRAGQADSPPECSSIWLMREYHKRMWLLSREMQEKSAWPLQLSLHATNCLCIPVLTWSDTVLDLEWSWENGTKPFPPELLEIESTGRQIGAYPHVHYPLLGTRVTHPEDPERMAAPVAPEKIRTEWAMRVIFEILRQNGRGMNFDALDRRLWDFGYPEQCRIFHYWDEKYPVKIDSEEVKSILLQNGGRVMLILASWSEKEMDVTVRLDPSLHAKESVFKLHLRKFDSAIIETEIKKK